VRIIVARAHCSNARQTANAGNGDGRMRPANAANARTAGASVSRKSAAGNGATALRALLATLRRSRNITAYRMRS